MIIEQEIKNRVAPARGADSSLAVGIDLGGTKIAAVLMSRGGAILHEAQVAAAPEEGELAVAGRIAQLIDAMNARASGAVLGAGIGSPGRVDPCTGIVYDAVNLGWEQVALADLVHARLQNPVPVTVQQDANIEALGEYYFGAARGLENFVYLGLGTGLGGGVIVNGKIVTGATLSAGEMGHLSLDPAGVRCACGNRGCAETVVSGRGVVRLARQRIGAGRLATSLTDDEPLTSARVLDAARAEDPLAKAVIEECAEWLGTIFAGCVAVVNPAAFVIGGGFGRSAFDLLLPGVRRRLAAAVLQVAQQELLILPSEIESSAVGAAASVWDSL